MGSIYLPDEIWMDIILNLSIDDVLSINILSNKFHQLIKSYKITDKYKSHVINFTNSYNINKKIKILINEYNFMKYDLSGRYKITDESVKLLTGLHTLNLSRCDKITDESVKLLTGLHTLNLYGCNVTDSSVKLLTGLHTLNLTRCYNVTDESVKLLTGLHTLDLTGCKEITDDRRVT